MSRQATPRMLITWSLCTGAGFFLIHLALAGLMRQGGFSLGAVTPDLTPLYAYWNPHLKPGLLAPLACAFLYTRWVRRTAVCQKLSDLGAILGFMAWFLTLALTLPLIDGGPSVWIAPYVSRPELEYFGAIDQVHSIQTFLGTYVNRLDSLPMHARVHPPGAIILLSVLASLLGGGPWGAALGTIGFSTLAVPLVFGLGRSIGGPALARQSTALFVATPCVLLFTATCMDGPFMVVLIATLWAFWLALTEKPIAMGLLAGSLAATGALLTYSVAIVLIFCAIAWFWRLLSQPDRRVDTLAAGASALMAFLIIPTILWATTGFNPVEMLQKAIGQDHKIMSGTRHESLLRHGILAVGNLSAFAISVGLPTAAIYLGTLSQTSRFAGVNLKQGGSLTTFLFSGAATLLIAAALPVYTMEVERIWLFLVPLVVIPAAALLVENQDESSPSLSIWAVRLLLGQAILTEVLLGTYW